MTNTTEQLSPSAVAAILERRARMNAESLAGACAELEHVQKERDLLRTAVTHAVAELRAGRYDTSLVALEGTASQSLRLCSNCASNWISGAEQCDCDE